MEKWQPLIDYLSTFMREELARQDHNATGALSKSLRVDAKEGDGETTIAGYGNSYGFFVNDGRRPGGTYRGEGMREAIYRWMLVRGIGAELQKEYQRRGLAYVITRSICEHGYPRKDITNRTGFVDKIFTEHSDEIESIIRRIVDDNMQMTNTEFINYWKHKKGQE